MTGGDRTTPVARHTLADHALGADWAHVHDGTADHEHDIPEDDGPIEENPIWLQDHVFLSSVGMDIGSSGTQVIFSRLELRRRSVDLSSRYFVVSRETVHESPVALTPYQSETRIDEQALGLIIGEAYEAAGMRPEDVDTGAVILTGEALRGASSSAPPPATTWRPASPPSDRAPPGAPSTRAGASSTSTSAAARRSWASSRAAR
jgi:ethanolamine utilization protein EutA